MTTPNLSTADIRERFRRRVLEKRIIITPGVFDAVSALLAQQAGFEAVFFSGSAVAFSQLARPDIGLLSVDDLADGVARAADRVSAPILADIDSAFGGAPNAARTIRAFERAGAAAVQMEDQALVKPSDALTSRPLISIEEMTDKIHAMTDARHSSSMLISARTDALDPAEAVERCSAYREAGADLVFAERIKRPEDVSRLAAAAGATPLVHNVNNSEPGADDACALETLGVRVAIFPGVAIQHAIAGMKSGLEKLAADPSLPVGGTSPLPAGGAIGDIIGASEYLEYFARSRTS